MFKRLRRAVNEIRKSTKRYSNEEAARYTRMYADLCVAFHNFETARDNAMRPDRSERLFHDAASILKNRIENYEEIVPAGLREEIEKHATIPEGVERLKESLNRYFEIT